MKTAPTAQPFRRQQPHQTQPEAAPTWLPEFLPFTSKQLLHIATNPMAHMQFLTSSRLPALIRPRSPLIDLLVQLSPRDRLAIVGLTVAEALGYSGSRTFRSAEAALRWIRPEAEMLESQSWPARSWQNKRFILPLTLDTLLAQASAAPPELAQRYPALGARPAPIPPRPGVADADDESGAPATSPGQGQ